MIDPLVRNHCRPGAVVLDPFAGSGSVLARAAHFGHAAIGFEKNPEFFAMAHTRLFGVPPLMRQMPTAPATLLDLWQRLQRTNDATYAVAA